MKRRTERAQSFARRASRYSTRISARGFGFADMRPLDCELLPPVREQVEEMMRVALLAAHEALNGPSQEHRGRALCQLRRLRGHLGNWMSQAGDPKCWSTADTFMNVVRMRLSADLFEVLLDETRLLRERAALALRDRLAEVLRRTKLPLNDPSEKEGK